MSVLKRAIWMKTAGDRFMIDETLDISMCIIGFDAKHFANITADMPTIIARYNKYKR
jgi:hypothetical protein